MNYYLQKDTPMTPSLIERYYSIDHAEQVRKQNLYNYYLGKHKILNRSFDDISKPNNKVVNPFAHYITDTMTGYFMGDQVKYKSLNDDMLAAFKDIFNYNDEASENSNLAKDASICGQAFELMWIDQDGNLRFKSVSPIGCIAIYDNELEPEMLYFLRKYKMYDVQQCIDVEYVEVYSRRDYTLYKSSVGSYVMVDYKPHNFSMVPVVEYQNNQETTGDFELVVNLIDAYDSAISDSINDQDYFSDAYLAMYGVLGTDSEDIAKMKENRVLLFDTDAKAEWLTKQVNDSQQENIKNRLSADIHKFSFCPAMTDEDFAANASGVAIKYKLMGLENATAKKESAFKKGLQKRIEIICGYLLLLGTSYNYMDMEIVFSRNIPSNIDEVANVITKVGHLLSAETQVSMLPLDIDYEQEKERIQKEEESRYSLPMDQEEGN